ncbi:recombinase family protein [Bradyrhizobium sp. WSM471]|uniref:recombinase family protein n=1 Tax=Bradyrhizobium sp. WSM471 TaxID=319017 RepID=UPI00024D1A52|nr:MULTISPECIES: recombinase family protein [Bradyrhizobium]EHQ99498.1 site-specific recombinase, DNA invertase Pin [Bradyrhizobium sp. WSM471]UFW41661.1 recombinase family protein [Bradyrhizobium canariense]
MKIGYARVSSGTQDHAAQIEALKAVGCERIFQEKVSGSSINGRPEFARLRKTITQGDVLVVSKLDRLARSSRDLQNILHELQEVGCGFVSLGESWCDTTTDVGRLVMTIMGGIAEFERSLIRKRCEEGIQRARRKGTKFGRPTALDHSQRRRLAERYAAGETMAELAREYECGETTIWRALQ